jgi:Cyclic nucleotide-binding domain
MLVSCLLSYDYLAIQAASTTAHVLMPQSVAIVLHTHCYIVSQVLVDVIKRVEVKPGDYVIKQGDIGDRFYIIDSGTFEVRVQQDGIEVSL